MDIELVCEGLGFVPAPSWHRRFARPVFVQVHIIVVAHAVLGSAVRSGAAVEAFQPAHVVGAASQSALTRTT
jgi:hypothetical protein